ncbi:MAG: substrate-binding domain-containing protein, partial [Victivallaceae bacterium]|nr:substrate-binding domain-containing protein [Victivallaceae bacterium]
VDNCIKGINAPFVGTDFEKGSLIATEYLIKNGHRKIGHLAGPGRILSTFERIKGFRGAFHNAGLECPDSMTVNCEYNEKNTKSMFMKLKEKHPEMTAVYCAGLDMTKGVLAGAKELKMDIPRDMSIVDFGSTSFVSSLDQNGDEVGKLAAKTLLDLLDGKKTASRSLVVPKLIPGNSVRHINYPG